MAPLHGYCLYRCFLCGSRDGVGAGLPQEECTVALYCRACIALTILYCIALGYTLLVSVAALTVLYCGDRSTFNGAVSVQL